MPPQAPNPALANLFRDAGSPGGVAYPNYVRRGSLATFAYAFWVHDPYPLLLVTDVAPGARVRGVNLHYLTFPFIRSILNAGCGRGFSYGNFKTQSYIKGAFRSYKWQGIRQVKMLDCDFLLTVMATVRSFDPGQVAAIRRTVQEQIRRETNPVAEPGEQAL